MLRQTDSALNVLLKFSLSYGQREAEKDITVFEAISVFSRVQIRSKQIDIHSEQEQVTFQGPFF